MLIEQQIAERQARASRAVVRVLERPAGSAYGDYKIKSGSGRIYRIAVRLAPDSRGGSRSRKPRHVRNVW